MLNDFSIAPRSDVFCDYMRFTTPQGEKDAVMRVLEPYFAQLGLVDDYKCMRSPSGGTVTLKDHYQVTSYQFTGSIIEELRYHGLYLQLLAELSTLPSYRLTRCHLTLDVQYPGWLYVPWFYSQCRAGQMQLSRKSVASKDMIQYFSPSQFSPSHDTGTVYLGSRKAERRLRVYDKQQERYVNRSLTITPTTRLEIELSDETGVTLRDLYEPTACFYHFIPSNAIRKPDDIPAWKPSESMGAYKLDRSEPPSPFKRATTLIDQIEPVLKSIRKLSMIEPDKSEVFQEMVLARLGRALKGHEA